MKKKIIGFLGVTLILFAAACSEKPQAIVSVEPPETAVNRTITTSNDFQETLTRWTGMLAEIALNTNEAYNNWTAGHISKEEFTARILQINEKMKLLKRQSDLKTEFNMGGTYDEQVHYDTILHVYSTAKKNLNDFLYLAPELSEKQIQDMYNSNIQEDFNENFTELKKQLSIE